MSYLSKINGKQIQNFYIQRNGNLCKVKDMYSMTANGLRKWVHGAGPIVIPGLNPPYRRSLYAISDAWDSVNYGLSFSLEEADFAYDSALDITTVYIKNLANAWSYDDADHTLYLITSDMCNYTIESFSNSEIDYACLFELSRIGATSYDQYHGGYAELDPYGEDYPFTIIPGNYPAVQADGYLPYWRAKSLTTYFDLSANPQVEDVELKIQGEIDLAWYQNKTPQVFSFYMCWFKQLPDTVVVTGRTTSFTTYSNERLRGMYVDYDYPEYLVRRNARLDIAIYSGETLIAQLNNTRYACYYGGTSNNRKFIELDTATYNLVRNGYTVKLSNIRYSTGIYTWVD